MNHERPVIEKDLKEKLGPEQYQEYLDSLEKIKQNPDQYKLAALRQILEDEKERNFEKYN